MNLRMQKKIARTSAPQLQGHVDAFEGGYLRGWARDVEQESTRVRISVRCGARTVGVGVADMYRPDLKEAELGDGHHGFAILLSDETRGLAGQQIQLFRDDGQPITTNRYTIPAPGPVAWGELAAEHGGVVRATVTVPDLDDGPYTLDLWCGKEHIGATSADFRRGAAVVRFGVPVRLVDGDTKPFALGLRGHPHALARASLALQPIPTPWEHLKRGSSAIGAASLASSAGSRYESLRAHLRAIGEGRGALSIAAIDRVHSLVVEGWEGRTEFPPFALPSVQEPEVSILIPAHDKLELTYHACASIALAYNRVSYEVIVIDDASRDRTREIEKIIENVVVVRNDPNKGFLRSVNTGATRARGRYLVVLNNDTEVTSGWLDELVAAFEDPKVGLAGSKLLNLDGTLQEAGGIVWGNGQPWNVGRGANPWTPEYNYMRDVDYVSGAALCVRRSLWEQLGGFSDELAPAYYEDTDLAYKVREAGYRVVYVPRSEVVHFEGQSNGRDVTQGIKRYQVVNEGKFREKWFDAYRGNGRVGVDLQLQKDRGVDHRVLVIDYCTPDPQRDAGSHAAVQEMKLFQSLGFKVTFVPRDLAHLGKLTWDLQRRGIEVLYAPFYHSLHEVLQKRGSEFDVVYITRFEVAEVVLDAVRRDTKAKVIFNNADLHFLRMLRAFQASGSPTIEEALAVRDRELATMRHVDAIVSYSEVEHAVILSHNLRDDNVFRCPWVVEERPPGPGFDEREGIAFLGGYRHVPNVEGVLYFVKNVLPRVREREPELKLYLYGSHPPPEIRELASENVVVVGFVEDLDEVFHRHRVFVAPLLSGAGLKGKVVEAMAYGLPTVLTKVAAEATGLTDGTNAILAESPEDWAAGISTYLHDRRAWESARESMRALARRQFDFRAAREQWRKVLAGVGIFTRAEAPNGR